jgi:hypothetical protein
MTASVIGQPGPLLALLPFCHSGGLRCTLLGPHQVRVQWLDHRPVFLTLLSGALALCGFFVCLLLFPSGVENLDFLTLDIKKFLLHEIELHFLLINFLH